MSLLRCELQFAIAKMSAIMRNILREQFLQVDASDAPYDQTYLIHHVEVPDFSFAPNAGSVLATAQPLVHLVPFLSIIEQPNQLVPPTNAAPMTVSLTIAVNSNTPGQLFITIPDPSMIETSALAGFLSTKQMQTLIQTLLNLNATVDLTQFLPTTLLSGIFSGDGVAVSADAQHVAVRSVDVPDAAFAAFVAGTFPDRLQGQDWSIFIAQEILTMDVRLMFQHTLNGISTIDVMQGPDCSWSAPPPAVDTKVEVGLTASQDNLALNINGATVFELAPYISQTQQGGVVHWLRLDTTFSAAAANLETGTALLLLGQDATTVVGQQIKANLPQGMVMVSTNEFTQDLAMPQISMLGAPGFQTHVSGDSDGLGISGNLQPSQQQDASLSPVVVTPFAWFWDDFCSDHSATKGPYQDQVKTHASAILGGSNKPGVNRQIHIWYLQQYIPFEPPANADPLETFSNTLIMPDPGSDVTAIDIDIVITAPDFIYNHPDYWANPYPCTILCVTSAGAIYLSLGEVDKLNIDPKTGKILNAQAVYINDCHYVDVDPWYVYFRTYNPRWGVDPYVGEVSELIAGRFTIGEILQVALAGAQAGERLTLESQDMAAATSMRTILADSAGNAQFMAYLPVSANPAPLRVTRALSGQPLRLAQTHRTLLTQATRLALPARIQHITGWVVSSKTLLQVTTDAGVSVFDITNPAHPQPVMGGRAVPRAGFFARLWAWLWRRTTATPETEPLPAGLVRIGEIYAARDDRHHNTVALFHGRAYRESPAGAQSS